VNADRLLWYGQRLRTMSGAEVAWRSADHARKARWRARQVSDPRTALDAVPGGPAPSPGRTPFGLTAADVDGAGVPGEARRAVLGAAEEILRGRWRLLGVDRTDLEDPDWFHDPVTGRRAPDRAYSFGIDFRSPAVTGDVKQVWELSRLHHLTVLAAAYALSGDPRYAERVAAHLRSWWLANGFLSGIHWTSGIEVGIRLLSLAWIRRLLEPWERVEELFERNPLARVQIAWHQTYLAGFRSRGSSANNHVVAEAAGQLVGALAFPWFARSADWEAGARALLETELERNTFPSGLNREMATDYHRLVAELALLAVVEADHAGRPLSGPTLQRVTDMLDAAAALLDAAARPPRQGDSDDGHALVLGDHGHAWSTLLATGRAVVGGADWWPPVPDDATSALVGAVGRPHHGDVVHRPRRPSHFPDAGLTILRAGGPDGEELWCRCDAGPHGFLSIAAHAHADALSVEVRHDGVELLVDPGTYCYQGHPAWRQYFRSTLAHNTVELGGRDQSDSGGPTLWTRHAVSRLLELDQDDEGTVRRWRAEHDGYLRHRPAARHRRTVAVAPDGAGLEIRDEVLTSQPLEVRLAFHLAPDVEAVLGDGRVDLRWTGRHGRPRQGTLELAPGMAWESHRGATDPVLGWYSPSFGCKEPTTAVIGATSCRGDIALTTTLRLG